MCSNEANEDNIYVVSHMNYQAIIVTFYIENYAVISNNAGITIGAFDI
jgi:hypothetical protein